MKILVQIAANTKGHVAGAGGTSFGVNAVSLVKNGPATPIAWLGSSGGLLFQLVATSLFFAVSLANAGSIIYTESTIASGTLGSNSFTNSLVTLTYVASLSNVTSGSGFIGADPGGMSVTVASLGSATVTDANTAVVENTAGSPPYVGFTDFSSNNWIFGTQGGAFSSYDMVSPIGPITGISDTGKSGATVGTNQGTLVLNSYGATSTFDATLAETVTLPGGPSTAPVLLLGTTIGEVTSTIGGAGTEDYYSFFWGGGEFSSTARITGADPGASYAFSFNPVSVGCANGPIILNSSDNFTYTYDSSPLLEAGDYCIGVEANSALDPDFSITFNTPVQGSSATPEPSSWLLCFAGLGFAGLAWCSKAAEQKANSPT